MYKPVPPRQLKASRCPNVRFQPRYTSVHMYVQFGQCAHMVCVCVHVRVQCMGGEDSTLHACCERPGLAVLFFLLPWPCPLFLRGIDLCWACKQGASVNNRRKNSCTRALAAIESMTSCSHGTKAAWAGSPVYGRCCLESDRPPAAVCSHKVHEITRGGLGTISYLYRISRPAASEALFCTGQIRATRSLL